MTGKNRIVIAFAAAAIPACAALCAAAGPAEAGALPQLRAWPYPGPAVQAPLVPAPVPVPSAVPGGEHRRAADPYNALIWKGGKGDWYEWWYYKVVLPGTGESFYFCYGVVNPWDGAQSSPASRSFVSAGSFGGKEVVEEVFPVAAFSASPHAASVKIGPNTATDTSLKGSLAAPGGGTLSWDLSVEKDWGANLMGWTMHQGWISNIYWYPAQAGARMSGTVTWRGKTYKLIGAPAYQDRNWGRSFPKWWTWLVSNNFKGSPDTVLASGGGQPRIFPGVGFVQSVTVGLRHGGREYFFIPPDGDIVKVDVNFGRWEVRARNRRGERLELSAWAPRGKFLLLKFMTPQGQVFNDYEALAGRMTVKLYKGDDLIADLETEDAGIEYGSPLSYGDKPGGPFEALFTQENHLQ